MHGSAVRSSVALAELLVGLVLTLLVLSNVAWCAWALPRHGVLGPHGIETASCSWWVYMVRGIALVTGIPALVLGGLAYWRSRSVPLWLGCQVVLALLVFAVALELNPL